MPPKVTLEAVRGALAGQRFAFDERTTCIIGRAKDCNLRVPRDDEHRRISRHHCLLDINPPDIRVRDFGSLNGTYVNGKKIGQRAKGQSAEEASGLAFPEHDLKDGDEIKLGPTVFRVSIHVPVCCSNCGMEIPEAEQRASGEGTVQCLCKTCRGRVSTADRPAAVRRTVIEAVRVCTRCGRDVGNEAGTNRQGEYICTACRSDPLALVRQLVQQAGAGDRDLVAIEGYEVVRELGRGGMGAVYLAKHLRSRKHVALKVMLPQVAASEAAVTQFRREIDNTKALRHPNVVRLHDFGSSQGTFFFTLEFCDGGSVTKMMEARGGRLSVDEAGPIILQVLDGLHYAHHAPIPHVRLNDGSTQPGRGLVHRDLKPQNMFLRRSREGRIAKVGDYGLAKAFDAAGLSGQTCTGTVAGTPYFMPRQQVRNFRYAKPEVDVWAAAASFYYMVTGCAPRDFMQGKDPWQTVLQTDPAPIRQRDPAIPKRLAAVIDEALVDNPEIRFKSAAALKHALEGAL